MASTPIEVRMAHLEGAYEQISARLGAVEERLGRVEDKLSRLEDKIDGRFIRLEERSDGIRTELLSRMDRQFYWILTLVVISILGPIFLRFLGA